MTGLKTDWAIEATAARRDQYYAASQHKFIPFKEPMVFKKGSMQYLLKSWPTIIELMSVYRRLREFENRLIDNEQR